MAASLGESYERFSVRLPHSNGKESKYLDEYMEVGKKDPKTGELTRFIFSKEETFGLEITLKAGFNHGYYDGVIVKLSDVNSGGIVWQKRYPKSNVKEPSQQDQKILIGSIDYAMIDGKLKSKVLMKLAPLVPDDFRKPGANETCRYPRMLEGICISICKYKRAGDIQLTKEEFDLKLKEHALKLENYARTDGEGSLDTPKRILVHRKVYQKHNITHKLRLVDGVAVPNEDIEVYLVPPTNTKKLFRYSDTQNFYYLWRGEKFFDTTAIAQTPIALIRQPWDILTPREREEAYGELSKYDFQQIWSHHFKALGPKPNKAATDALKNQLRENLPDYWRSWHKLYLYEISRAFKMLQERRRFLDRGEIPEDLDIIGKSEEAPIKLENTPKKLEKFSEKIRIPSLTHPGRSVFLRLAASSPKLATAPMYEPESSPQSKSAQIVAGMSSAMERSAKTEPSGASILGRASASITGVLGPINERLLCLECDKNFVSDRAFLDHFQPTHGSNFGDLNQAMMDKISPDAFSNSLPGVWANTRATELMKTTSRTLAITSSSEVPAPKGLNNSLSISFHVEHRMNSRLTKPATNKSSKSKSSSTKMSVPKTITEPIFKTPKRPAGIADLSELKRQSSKMRRMMGYIKGEMAMYHSPLAIEQATRPSVLSPACVKSSVFEKDNLTDPMDLDNSRMIVAANPSKPGATSSSSFTSTSVSPSLQTASLSVSSSEKPQASQIVSYSTSKPLPVLPPPSIPEPSSVDTSSTNLPMITSSNSHVISVLDTSSIESCQITSIPDIDEVDTSAELPTAVESDVNTPSEIGSSTRLAAETPSIVTETTASSVIPVIDLDKWVSSPEFIAIHSSTSSSASVIKSETDTDKKLQMKVEEDPKIPEAEMKSSEEEERRRETELEDAIRIAEARMELHRVRRKIETLRSGSL
ncbi:uncharacterized protein Bfra_007610 [Botrytis fragariae]|uniref:C2H2-type domain-containing protein n=1 Tax=Botrytis fragariae TaxID=1964551 RepID=A0A8H6EG62_9HELO|nr:uncharacterized protein Bfra_007610 [Botrytis fragariae]KAF5871097.1 hypothetical protein Bfra_007610 [Botrytis fragariae]